MAENMAELWSSWDMTFKAAKSGDFVVGALIGSRGPDFFILDLIRGQMTFSAALVALKSLVAKWTKAGAVLVEDKANGPAIMDAAQKEVRGIIAIEPDGDKVARAAAIAPYQEAGNFLPPGSKVRALGKRLYRGVRRVPGRSARRPGRRLLSGRPLVH
jgi:predicted phage terminase large subunit-like protein